MSGQNISHVISSLLVLPQAHREADEGKLARNASVKSQAAGVGAQVKLVIANVLFRSSGVQQYMSSELSFLLSVSRPTI